MELNYVCSLFEFSVECFLSYRNLPAGFEQFIPVLFLDLTDELVPVDEDTEGTVEAGELFGEKPDTMINLPVINSEKTMVGIARVI